MFDTNVFNHILDGKIIKDAIPNDWKVFGTHIQKDEINNTKDITQRRQLLEIFDQWVNVSLPTESAVWGVSKWDECKWGDEEIELYENILHDLDNLERKINNKQDALIAETAIKNNLCLITNDGNLKDVAQRYGAEIQDLTAEINSL